MTRIQPITAELLRSLPLPWPEHDTDKNSRGTVLVAGGSLLSPGAATLAGLAALRAGAGKVNLAVPRALAREIAVSFPEAGVHAFASTNEGQPRPSLAAREILKLLARADVALIGPGLSDEAIARDLTCKVLGAASNAHFIIDAMALTGMWDHADLIARHRGRLVITPHPGEMAKLSGTSIEAVRAEPVSIAESVAARLSCIVVLKGADTVVAQPDGPSWLHEGDCVGLATSGSGDVLAGLLAALIARGATPEVAAIWAVYLHAQAGLALSERIGPLGFLARELPAEIPRLMEALR
jgi:ADP-dependent NAD(P)H-hydrate dehydratase